MSLGTIKKRQEAAVSQSPFARKLKERRGENVKSRSFSGIPRDHSVVLYDLYEAGWNPTMAYKPAPTEEMRQLLLELAEANAKSTRKAMKRRWK